MKKLCVAIDGPASSGKSTVAKLVAKACQYIYLDTGAMYRAITYAVLQANIDVHDEQAVATILDAQTITFETTKDNDQRVILNQEDVTQVIRLPHISQHVSLIASYQAVRTYLVDMQRTYIQEGGIVMDGRDVGTVVMPQADVKIYMVASVEERARRRYEENLSKGIDCTLESLQKSIAERDYLDENRAIGPLKKAADAILIDTTELSISQVSQKIIDIIMEKQ